VSRCQRPGCGHDADEHVPVPNFESTGPDDLVYMCPIIGCDCWDLVPEPGSRLEQELGRT
jgi:hypothetical protein